MTQEKTYNREFFVDAGRTGGNKKSINYRQYLLVELGKLVSKGKLNFYQEYAEHDFSGRLLREAWMVELKIKEQNK